MDLVEALIVHLRNTPNVRAMVGDRVYGAGLEEQAAGFPRLTVFMVGGGDPSPSHDGPSGIERSRWQVTCTAPAICTAVRTITRVVNALDGFKGVLGNQETGEAGLYVSRVAKVDQSRGDIPRDAASRMLGHKVDFVVWARFPS